MIIGTEQGVQLNIDPELSMVWYKFHIGDEENMYGTIRYEIVPSAVIVHVNPVEGVTRARLQVLKEASDFLAQEFLVDHWGFKEIYFVTKNHFLVNLLSRGMCEQVGETEAGPLYRANIEEVLWPTQ